MSDEYEDEKQEILKKLKEIEWRLYKQHKFPIFRDLIRGDNE